MKTKERIIDLSDIKEDELDKTASFTDLMTRSERRKRKKEKNMKKIYEEKKEENNNENFLTNEIENISKIETIEEALSQTKKYEDLSQTINKDINLNNDEFEDIEDYDQKKYGSGLMITMGLFLLISTSIFIYSILFTNNLNKDKFLYIDIISLLGMYFLFGLSIISNKKISKILSIFNYIIFTIFIAFNVLIILNYIK